MIQTKLILKLIYCKYDLFIYWSLRTIVVWYLVLLWDVGDTKKYELNYLWNSKLIFLNQMSSSSAPLLQWRPKFSTPVCQNFHENSCIRTTLSWQLNSNDLIITNLTKTTMLDKFQDHKAFVYVIHLSLVLQLWGRGPSNIKSK